MPLLLHAGGQRRECGLDGVPPSGGDRSPDRPASSGSPACPVSRASPIAAAAMAVVRAAPSTVVSTCPRSSTPGAVSASSASHASVWAACRRRTAAGTADRPASACSCSTCERTVSASCGRTMARARRVAAGRPLGLRVVALARQNAHRQAGRPPVVPELPKQDAQRRAVRPGVDQHQFIVGRFDQLCEPSPARSPPSRSRSPTRAGSRRPAAPRRWWARPPSPAANPSNWPETPSPRPSSSTRQTGSSGFRRTTASTAAARVRRSAARSARTKDVGVAPTARAVSGVAERPRICASGRRGRRVAGAIASSNAESNSAAPNSAARAARRARLRRQRLVQPRL